jgi:tetratricopeptide (TPR) repeat protein
LNTPVPATTVIDMLEGEVPAEVGRALSTLVTHRIVYRAGRDLYFLPAEDGRLVMEGMSDQESRSLYYLAADHLTQLRSSNPRDVHDLRVHFAELDALLRAREPGAAYEMIQLIDDVLREWNCSHLLFERRQGLVGEFGEDDHQEMANYNALADIHVSRGQYKEAADLYGRALTIANAQSDDFNKMKIFTNLAGLYWDWNETGHALAYYEHGRDEALRQGNPQVLMATEEGIADCHRRQGGYDEAIKHAKVALATPKQADYPDTDTAQAFARSRTVTIALKLARWLSELGRSSEAWQFVEVARTTAADHPSARLQAAYLDGWAGTMLYRDELDTAETVALSAVDLALRQRDPVVLLQARTTLCFLYLKWGRSKHARTEIELARPYRRRKFRSLVVLALLALTSHQIGDRLTAKERFRQLLDESIYRTERDPEDFAAWDFRGYALCGLHLDTTNDLSDAIAAFQTARNLTPPTPALVERMRFMIEQLDRPDLLRPVLDVL